MDFLFDTSKDTDNSKNYSVDQGSVYTSSTYIHVCGSVSVKRGNSLSDESINFVLFWFEVLNV